MIEDKELILRAELRVWDDHREEMRYIEQVNLDDMRDGRPEWFHNIMPNTGYVDKNGRAIYMGDILDFEADEERGHSSLWESVVELSDVYGWDWGNCPASEVSEWCAVIGNIWETPELDPEVTSRLSPSRAARRAGAGEPPRW